MSIPLRRMSLSVVLEPESSGGSTRLSRRLDHRNSEQGSRHSLNSPHIKKENREIRSA